MSVLASWVLDVMLHAQPKAAHVSTFERTAMAIAEASNKSPLFSGTRGAEKTAMIIVGVAEYESGFIPDAEGDCMTSSSGSRKLVPSKAGRCPAGSAPNSLCLLQISKSNLATLGVTREELLTSVDKCVEVGLRMMHQSFSICRARALNERLSWYAAGSNECTAHEDALKKSRHRVDRAFWLFNHFSPP